MNPEALGQAHDRAVTIIDKYAKSHHAAALMLGTLADAEIKMLHGATPAQALAFFMDPLASRLLKVYNSSIK